MSPGAPAAGYSGTPLARKLGIKAGARVHLIDAPAHAWSLLEPLPEDVVQVSAVDTQTDLVWLFCLARERLANALARLRVQIRSDAAIWVSWPKKASKVATDITEDSIREVCLPLGLVDIKVCAVDATWSGLKLVIRKVLR